MTVERTETQWVLHVEGECSMAAAAEMRGLLLEGLRLAPELVVDLEGVAEIDVAVLQLLWSAEQAAGQGNRKFFSRVPEALARAAREAGFGRFPGEPLEAVQAGEAVNGDQAAREELGKG